MKHKIKDQPDYILSPTGLCLCCDYAKVIVGLLISIHLSYFEGSSISTSCC